MTPKEYLKQLYRLNQKINSDIAEAAGLREMAESVSSPGFEEHYSPNRPAEASFVHCIERLCEMERQINAEVDQMVNLKEQIRVVIGKVENPDEQMVLRYRYIHNYTWEQIGRKLNADRTTVYRWHNTALTHVALPKNPIQI